MIENLYVQLLQIAIGNRLSLDYQPAETKWRKMLELSKRHNLSSILFKSVVLLRDGYIQINNVTSGVCNIPERLFIEWRSLYEENKRRNIEISSVCASLCKDLAHDGLYACILKGQSNLVNYPEELRDCRTPDDIDVWCAPMDPEGIDIAVIDADGKGAHYEKYVGKRGVIEWVLMQHLLDGMVIPKGNYHHANWNYKGLECEVYFTPSWMNCPLRNRRFQIWCKVNEQWNTCEYNGLNIPSASFNAVYQMVRIYRDLFNDGIGLGQLLDYYFVLRALHIEQGMHADRTESMTQWAEGMRIAVKNNAEIMHTLSRFGMKKFASATMYVLQTVFAMPDEYLICPPNEKEGKFLLNEIMQAGNFGKYDNRIKHETPSIPLLRGKKVPQQLWHALEKTKHNLRLLSHYPEEVLCEPFFRLYHWAWRRFELWRW